MPNTWLVFVAAYMAGSLLLLLLGLEDAFAVSAFIMWAVIIPVHVALWFREWRRKKGL